MLFKLFHTLLIIILMPYVLIAENSSTKQEHMPAGFDALEQLSIVGNLDYNPNLEYESSLLAFSRVFSQQHFYSQKIFTAALLTESKNYNLDPCFIAGLLASSIEKSSSEENLSLIKLFGQDEANVSSLARLLKLEQASTRSYSSEHFVSRYFVRYASLLRELLGNSAALVALAWHLGFDELALRLKNEHYRTFSTEDLKRLSVINQATELCRLGASKAAMQVDLADSLRASIKPKQEIFTSLALSDDSL